MQVDLNADLGEGSPHDSELLQLITSANISCGAHAGTSRDIDASILNALRNDVAIGAHPSYPDRRHFGRRPMRMPDAELRATLHRQILDLVQRVQALGGSVQHIKPHGALYNQAAGDQSLAVLICEVVESVDDSLSVVGLAGSDFIRVARDRGLHCLQEAFADRRYNDDGTLVSREHPRALIHCSEEAGRQTLGLARGTGIQSITGSRLALKADTICIHGDQPEALTAARQLRRILEGGGMQIVRPSREPTQPEA